jgi:hypothetical protein
VKAAGIEPASFEVAESRMVPEPRLELGPSYEERILSRIRRGDESTFI